MGRHIEVAAVRRETPDVRSCVLALLAFAQQTGGAAPATGTEPGEEVSQPEASDG